MSRILRKEKRMVWRAPAWWGPLRVSVCNCASKSGSLITPLSKKRSKKKIQVRLLPRGPGGVRCGFPPKTNINIPSIITQEMKAGMLSSSENILEPSRYKTGRLLIHECSIDQLEFTLRLLVALAKTYSMDSRVAAGHISFIKINWRQNTTITVGFHCNYTALRRLAADYHHHIQFNQPN